MSRLCEGRLASGEIRTSARVRRSLPGSHGEQGRGQGDPAGDFPIVRRPSRGAGQGWSSGGTAMSRLHTVPKYAALMFACILTAGTVGAMEIYLAPIVYQDDSVTGPEGRLPQEDLFKRLGMAQIADGVTVH